MRKFKIRLEDKGPYIALMEDLIGKEISTNDLVIRNEEDLQQSCKIFNDTLIEAGESKFQVGIKGTIGRSCTNTVLEPCPLLYTGNLKEKFKFVFLGINPFLDSFNKMNNPESNCFKKDRTLWKDFSSYNCPNNKEKMETRSIYRHIFENAFVKKNGELKYHGDVFRFFQALLGKALPLDNIDDIKRIANDNEMDIEEYFFSEYDKLEYRVLHAEMIPYKSTNFKPNKSKFWELLHNEESGYKNYLLDLMYFIEKNTCSDALIIFLGQKDNVMNFLMDTKNELKILPKDIRGFSKFEKLFPNQDNGKKYDNHFFFFKYNGGDKINEFEQKNNRKVILAPFLRNRGKYVKFNKENNLIDTILRQQTYEI